MRQGPGTMEGIISQNKRWVGHFDRLPPQTERVLCLVMGGLSISEISEGLGIGHRTTKWHMYRIQRATGEPDRIAIAARPLLDAELRARVMDEMGKRAWLTDRQQEVLEMMIIGCTNKEIAESMELGISTIKTHAENIFTAHGVDKRRGLLALALEIAGEHKEEDDR